MSSLQKKETLLIVDDSKFQRVVIRQSLGEHFNFAEAVSGEECLTIMEKESDAIDLVLLDLMLPGLSGEEVLARIPEVPVIALSAKAAVQDKVDVLLGGAVDYMTKPFNPLELVARVKTQLRRYTRYNPGGGGEPEEDQSYDIRGLQISKSTHKCLLFGEELALTPLEFSILWYLCSKQGQVVSSEELFEAVWGEKYMDSKNTVMSHIARLREKMHENSRKPKFIKTVWGVGYTIE